MFMSAFKTKFLQTALPDIPFDGWTPELMARTAAKLKTPQSKVDMEFPNGAADLADYLGFWATEETLKRLDARKLGQMRVRDRIALGVRTRLEILTPCKAALKTSAFSPRKLWDAADKIWWAAGDTATDYNHYTKRALLSAVLASTTLFWLNDSSRGHEETWAFLDRRIDNVLTVGQGIARLKGFLKGA